MSYIGAKYVDFTRHLKSCGEDKITMTVEEIGSIISLPSWVLDPKGTPWANTKQSFAASWRNAGYKCLGKQGNIITFKKEN